MVQFDREFAATWVETFYAAYGAEDWAVTNKMLSDMSSWGQQIYADHINASEALDVIIVGLNRLNVAVPAGVTVARDAFTGIDWRVATIEKASVAPSLSRRAKLIIIGGAAVAAAAYVYHRRRAAKRAEDLEAVKSLLAGDSASSLDDAAAVTPQRRMSPRPSAKERSKVMERNKKLQAQKRAAETARDAATADASRARADNDRLRAENARLASNATAGDELVAARAEVDRLRRVADILSAESARHKKNAEKERGDACVYLAEKTELEKKFRSHQWDVTRHKMEKTRARSEVAACNVQMERLRAQMERLRADKTSLVDEARALAAERDLLHRENTSLLAERDALEESARLVPAPSAGDLAALPDEALSTFAAEAAALSHALVREEARRAATATAPTSECVVCQAAPLQIALGCGHFCACDACARGLSKCPICRAPVTERRRIYAS